MDVFIRYISLAGSIFSSVLTGYFWFVKWRRELPNLKAYIVDREIFLGNMTAEQRQLGLKFGIIVANYSYLPNSLLGVRLALKLQGENKWLDVDDVTFDPQTPMPFNLPALQTVLLRVNGRIRFVNTAALEQEKNIPAAYAKHHLAEPRTVRVELKALNDKTFTDTLTYGPPS